MALGLQLVAPAILAAANLGISRDVRLALGLAVLPSTYFAAGCLTSAAIAFLARSTITGRSMTGGRLPVALVALGIAYGFEWPGVWVVGLEETGSLYWHLVYLAFLPGSLLTGAQIALLGPIISVRSTRPELPFISGVACVLIAIGAPLLVYTVLWSFITESVRFTAVPLSIAGLGCDAVIALVARRAAASYPLSPAPLGPP